MRTQTIRKSRTIRKRIAKRKGMRAARLVEIDRKGLVIEGERFPFHVGAYVGIRHFGMRPNAILNVDILVDEVKVRGPFGRGVVITETWE